MATSYYKMIDGKRFDREMIEIAEEAVAGKGDGRISVEDANKLYAAIIDGNKITEIEQETLEYIKENFRFTDAAIKWLDDELEQWKKDNESEEKAAAPSPPALKETIVKEKPVQPPSPIPARKFSLIWATAALVFLLLLPVAYFIGKNAVSTKENPADKTRIEELEASLLSKEREMTALNSENKRLNDRISQLEASLSSKEREMTALNDENKRLNDRISQLEAEQAPASTGEEPEPAADTDSEIRNSIIAKLESSLAGVSAGSRIRLDKKNLVATFIPDQPFFTGDGSVLTPNLKDILSRFFPEFIQKLSVNDQKNITIHFQGYSSSDWKYADNRVDAYLKNMNLSIARAEAALKFCLNLDQIQQHKKWLTRRLVSSGFSDSKPILDQDNQEDRIHSRRISIAIEITRDKAAED